MNNKFVLSLSIICLLFSFGNSQSLTWSTINSNTLNWYYISSDLTGAYIAAADYSTSLGNGISLSSNYGNSWSYPSYFSAYSGISSVAMSGDGKYLVAGGSGYTMTLHTSSNYGSTWSQTYSYSDTSIVGYVNSIAASNTGQYFAACFSPGGMIISSNYGQTWSVSSAITTYYWYGVAMSFDASYMYASSNNGIFKTTNYGVSWTQVSTLFGSSFCITSSNTGQYVVFVSYSYNYIYYSSDYGATFTLSSSTSLGIVPFRVTSDSTGQYVYVVSYNANIFYSKDYGSTYSMISNSPSASWSSIIITGYNSRLYGCSYNGVIRMGYTGASTPTPAPSTRVPTFQPTAPTFIPTINPTKTPTLTPTYRPTSNPTTSIPTSIPTSNPTNPTSYPTTQPSSRPTRQPTSQPTSQPISHPTARPSSQPTAQPTNPTSLPTKQPSSQPTCQPSARPSAQPNSHPTSRPSSRPTAQPTNPTSLPTTAPSSFPTSSPTTIPDCPAGTYYVFTSSGYECVQCPAGSYSQSKAHECSFCPPGSYTNEPGQSTCILCPQNFYNSQQNQTTCIACPGGKVTGTLGSTKKAQCVNPLSNFITGFICLFFCFVAITFYLCCGRLHRVAAQRKARLIIKSIQMFNNTSDKIQKTIEVCKHISVHLEDERRKRRTNTYLEYFKIKILLPILFFFVSIVLTIVFTCLSFILSIIHILFNSLVLWRGYIRYLHLSFSYYERVKIFIQNIRIHFSVPYIELIAYPFVLFGDWIANLHINFNSVDITCKGSQAPIYLLVNCMIVGLIIIVIESDVQIFWSTSLNQLSNKFRSLLFNPYFLSRNICSSIYFLIWSVVMTLTPPPMKWIQYTLGFVSVSTFLRESGHSERTGNCDSVYFLPLDSILAYATTVFALIMICPMIYLFGQILVPYFQFENKPNQYSANEKHTLPRRYVSIIQRLLSTFSAIDWFYVKIVSVFAHRLFRYLMSFLEKVSRSKESHYENNEELQLILTDVQNTTLIRNQPVFIPFFFAWETACSCCSCCLTKEQSNKYEIINQEIQTEKQIWLQLEDTFHSYYRMTQEVCYELQHHTPLMKVLCLSCITPLMMFLAFLPMTQLLTTAGRGYWYRILLNYLLYLSVCLGVWTNESLTCFGILEKFDRYYPHLADGRQHLESFATPEEYYYSLQQRFSVEDFVRESLVNNNNDNNNLEARESELIRQSSLHDHKEYSQDDNIPQLIMLFVSAVASTRIVLLQLIPLLTMFSVISVDLSSSSIFIFSNQLYKNSPPLIFTHARLEARRILQDQQLSPHDEIPSWKIYCLAAYIFVSRSRLLVYSLTLFKNAVSVGIIFFPFHIQNMVVALVIALVVIGVLESLYFIVLLHRFFFPSQRNETNVFNPHKEHQQEHHKDIEITDLPAANSHTNTHNGISTQTDPITPPSTHNLIEQQLEEDQLSDNSDNSDNSNSLYRTDSIYQKPPVIDSMEIAPMFINPLPKEITSTSSNK